MSDREPEAHIETLELIPMDAQAIASIPRVYAQHVIFTFSGPEVVLTLCNEIDAYNRNEDEDKSRKVLVPQTICYLSLPQFMRFREQVNKQAEEVEQFFKERAGQRVHESR